MAVIFSQIRWRIVGIMAAILTVILIYIVVRIVTAEKADEQLLSVDGIFGEELMTYDDTDPNNPMLVDNNDVHGYYDTDYDTDMSDIAANNDLVLSPDDQPGMMLIKTKNEEGDTVYDMVPIDQF